MLAAPTYLAIGALTGGNRRFTYYNLVCWTHGANSYKVFQLFVDLSSRPHHPHHLLYFSLFSCRVNSTIRRRSLVTEYTGKFGCFRCFESGQAGRAGASLRNLPAPNLALWTGICLSFLSKASHRGRRSSLQASILRVSRASSKDILCLLVKPASQSQHLRRGLPDPSPTFDTIQPAHIQILQTWPTMMMQSWLAFQLSMRAMTALPLAPNGSCSIGTNAPSQYLRLEQCANMHLSPGATLSALFRSGSRS